MATTTKTKNSRASSRKSMRGRGRGGAGASPSRGPSLSRSSSSSGLLGRVHTTLPSRRRNAKKTGVQRAVAALGSAKSSTAARKPSTKSMLGIIAGGVGAAAMAKRRRNLRLDDPSEAPQQPIHAGDEDSPRVIETVADPTATTGGDRGDPQGSDSSAAA
jgi:hypothetical protein